MPPVFTDRSTRVYGPALRRILAVSATTGTRGGQSAWTLTKTMKKSDTPVTRDSGLYVNSVDPRHAARWPMRRSYNQNSTALPGIPATNKAAFKLTNTPNNIRGEQILLPSTDSMSARATGPLALPGLGISRSKRSRPSFAVDPLERLQRSGLPAARP